MEFNKHKPEDYQYLVDSNYLVRYHAGDRLLEAYGLPYKISELRRVFGLLIKEVKKNGLNEAQVKAAHLQAREMLLAFIEQYFHPPTYETLSKGQLEELLLDECYFQHPNLETIKQLIGAGADIYAKDDWGWTSFQRALSMFNQRDIIDFFLEKGVDVNYPYPPYSSAPPNFHITIWLKALTSYCEEEIIYLLIEKGAKVLDKDTDGNTALHLAASSLKLKKGLFQYFVEAGVPVNAQNNKGETALLKMNEMSYSEAGGGLDRMEYLLGVGADPNIKNKDGKTPLLLAANAYGGDGSAIRLLCKFGANVNELNTLGQTALMLAAERQSIANVTALLAYGADTKIRDAKGNTVYENAIAKGYMEIARLLHPDADKDYMARPEYEQIQELKKQIIAALRSGKSWSSTDKEGWRQFYFKDGKFIQESGEHQSDYHASYEYSEADALSFLYNNAGYYERLNKTEVEIWRAVLARLY